MTTSLGKMGSALARHRREIKPDRVGVFEPCRSQHVLLIWVGFGLRRFRNYRVRVLLYAGAPNWDLLENVTPKPVGRRVRAT